MDQWTCTHVARQVERKRICLITTDPDIVLFSAGGIQPDVISFNTALGALEVTWIIWYLFCIQQLVCHCCLTPRRPVEGFAWTFGRNPMPTALVCPAPWRLLVIGSSRSVCWRLDCLGGMTHSWSIWKDWRKQTVGFGGAMSSCAELTSCDLINHGEGFIDPGAQQTLAAGSNCGWRRGVVLCPGFMVVEFRALSFWQPRAVLIFVTYMMQLQTWYTGCQVGKGPAFDPSPPCPNSINFAHTFTKSQLAFPCFVSFWCSLMLTPD